MANVLILEEDNDIIQTVQLLLESKQHRVYVVNDTASFLARFSQLLPELVIVSYNAGILGDKVCLVSQIASSYWNIAIMVLGTSYRSTELAQALDDGADEYLVKPIDPIEFMARTNALLRRVKRQIMLQNDDYLEYGRLKLHPRKFEVQHGDQKVILTAVEHQLLFTLFFQQGTPVSTEHLLEAIWGYAPGDGNPNLVQVHITKLRSKLRELLAEDVILNIRKKGYMLAPA
jgi:DNA-binding response OmpR family regulator